MPKTRPAYTEEFRQQAVQLLLDSGRPLDRVAAELGVSANSLRSWRDRSLGRGRGAQAPSTQSKGRSATRPAPPSRSASSTARSNTSAASATS
ncbi:MAG: transposase [Verrucomicrobiales bacterium]|nr:transposase [Verrucomicrobiales bacterium]